MKFAGKEIYSLSDDELRDAIISVGEMDNFRYTKLKKPGKRHSKIFDKHPPTENSTFTNLVNALQNEFKSRKSKKELTNA